MKKLIYIISILGLCNFASAQTFTVGNTCCNYNLVNVTFTSVGASFSSYSNIYNIDIDGDLVSDIDIYSGGYSSGSAQFPSSRQISITSSTTCEFVYGPSGPSCWYSDLIDNIAISTPLNSSLNWSLTPASWGSTGQPAPIINYWWSKPIAITINCGIGINPFFIGFRKILPSTDTIYGWIRMDSNFPGKVIDYAYTCGTYTGTPPTSTITTPPVAICKGDSVLLNATPAGGMFFGTGVSGNYFKSKNLAAGVYTVNYALPNPNGCSIAKSTTIFTVIPTTTVPIYVSSSSLPSCPNQPITIVANGASTYTWNGSILSSSINVNPYSTTIYTVNGSGFAQCSYGLTTFTQTVVQPTVAVNSNSNIVCPGTTVQLNATGATTYSWSTGAIGSTCTVNPLVNTIYTVVATFSANCRDTGYVAISVATPTVIASTINNSICAGNSANLVASGANSYIWSNGCNTSNCAMSPTVTTTYSVVGYGYGTCSDTSTVTVYVDNSNLVIGVSSNDSIICSGDTTILQLSGASAYGIYSATDFFSTIQQTVAIAPQLTTTYLVLGNFYVGSCQATGIFTQSVSACVGINEIDNLNSSINIFPNPAANKITISVGEYLKDRKVNCEIISVEGKLLKSILITQSETEVDISTISAGIYFVELNFNNNKVRKKLIISR